MQFFRADDGPAHAPALRGLGRIATLAPEVRPWRGALFNFADRIPGCALIYGALFGTGKLLLGETQTGALLLGASLCGGAVIFWELSRRGWISMVN